MMDAPPSAVHMGVLRFGANQQMQDSLRAQARAFDYAYGGVAAVSPFPANTQRYRGYYARQLQQQQQQQQQQQESAESEQAVPPLSPQAQQLQEERQPAGGLEAGATGFAGAATSPSQEADAEKGLWGKRGSRPRKRRSRLRHKKKRARTAAAAAARHERRRERKHHEHPHQSVAHNGIAAVPSSPKAASERREHRHEARHERRRAKTRKKQRLKKQGLTPTVPTAVLLRAPEGDKGGLLYPVATFAHKKTTVKEAMARMAERQAEVVAPVIPPGPIGHAPPTPRPMALKPVVPAYYHGQTQYAKPHRAVPLVLSPPQHLHPKLAAHFGVGPGGPPLDYEHSGMCNNWCPGRRRLHQAEDKTRRWTYVYLGHGERTRMDGDKGMLFHEHKATPKVTKLVPIDRPTEYYAPPKPTILKPVHRVYTQPEPSVFVIAPRKKAAHPWLAKFSGYGHGHQLWGH